MGSLASERNLWTMETMIGVRKTSPLLFFLGGTIAALKAKETNHPSASLLRKEKRQTCWGVHQFGCQFFPALKSWILGRWGDEPGEVSVNATDQERQHQTQKVVNEERIGHLIQIGDMVKRHHADNKVLNEKHIGHHREDCPSAAPDEKTPCEKQEV